MVSLVDFESVRPQLTAVAFRMLGSVHDAEDAVQTTWLRANAAGPADTTGAGGEIRNSAAWLTTVLTRICLDHLRARGRRREEPLLADLIPAAELAADEQYLRRENVSRALMVVLDRLTPAQRVAYVLHDLFDVPFQQIAQTMNTSVVNAKKHASRARQRIGQPPRDTTVGAGTCTTADRAADRIAGRAAGRAAVDCAVVDAFLAAAAGGDIDRMITLMVADCVRSADPALLPPGTPSAVTGARRVAEETRLFADRIGVTTPIFVDGRRAHVIAPGGHLLAVVDIDLREGLVSRVAITRPATRLSMTLTPVNNP